jgi:hypothetical protein
MAARHSSPDLPRIVAMIARLLMIFKTYLVCCKTPEISTQSVVAASCDVYGEHLVFLNSKGELAAVFLLEIVESWSVVHVSGCAPKGFSELVEWGDSAWLPTPSMKIERRTPKAS